MVIGTDNGQLTPDSKELTKNTMMPEEFRQIIPAPQPEPQETFAAYQATSKFYREVQARETMKRYCEWYYTTAELHRQELSQMRGELNILAWFRRGRR